MFVCLDLIVQERKELFSSSFLPGNDYNSWVIA